MHGDLAAGSRGMTIGLGTVLALGSRWTRRAGRVLKGAAVEYMYPSGLVASRKVSDVALHFRVAEGLHINEQAEG